MHQLQKHLAILLTAPLQPRSQQWFVSVLASVLVVGLWVLSISLLGFSLPIYLGMILLVLTFVFLTPTSGLPIILLATMFFQHVFTLQAIIVGDSIIKLYPLDIVFLGTIIAFLFHQAFGVEKRNFYLGKIEGSIFTFILITSAYLVRGLVTASSDNALVISAFKNYAFYAFLYYVTLYTIQTKKDLKRFLHVFLWGGVGIIGFILFGFLRGQGLWIEFTPLSTSGVRYLSFAHAFYLSVVLVMSLVLVIYHLRPQRSSLVLMWIQLIGVLGSLMRHLWISLFALAVFLVLVFPKEAKKILVSFLFKNTVVVALLCSLGAFVVLLFPFSSISLQAQDFIEPLTSRAASLARASYDDSARWRIFAWRAARESFIENPLIGTGFGEELVIDFDTYQQIVDIRELHNSLLVILVQMGLLGMLVFLYLLYRTVHLFVQAYHARGMLWPYQLTFFSAWLVFLTASFWQPYFEANFTGIFFWILLGLFVKSVRLSKVANG